MEWLLFVAALRGMHFVEHELFLVERWPGTNALELPGRDV
jgi:hypothetical protein